MVCRSIKNDVFWPSFWVALGKVKCDQLKKIWQFVVHLINEFDLSIQWIFNDCFCEMLIKLVIDFLFWSRLLDLFTY